ncbi:MAG: LysR family transcriptional regulator [Gracilibacteraceae bacterium]|jgi:DNA-binding transcriptional LysR family regulator|nr:LysR family transcriptional regulator [Gracilibacteraceae bacterium]
MHSKHLESFVAVVEAGSFSAAAEPLYVSRTALIQQINLLEQHVGFQLLTRSNKGIRLTAAGQEFYEGAKLIIETSHSVMRRCLALDEASRDTVRIGSLPNFTPILLAEICRQYNLRYPQIRLQFVEYPLDSYFKNFVDGKFDLTTEYMSGYFFDNKDFQFAKLTEDKHCCGMSRSHHLAKKNKIKLSDLRGEKLILYAKGITRADDMLREYISKHEPEARIIDISHYNSSLPLICELEGCILIYYSMYWKSFPTLVTKAVDWDFPIDIGLGYKTNPRPAVKKFIELAKEIYSL